MTDFHDRHDPLRPQLPEEVREHMTAARTEVRQGIRALFPPDFLDHRDAARREMLLAWRGVLDAAIGRIDERKHP